MPEVGIVAAVALAAIAWICWRKALVHRDLADAYELVARMLIAKDPSAAEALAARHRQRKIAEGRWKS